MHDTKHQDLPCCAGAGEVDRTAEPAHVKGGDDHRIVRDKDEHKHLHEHKPLHSLRMWQYCSNHTPTGAAACMHHAAQVGVQIAVAEVPFPACSDLEHGGEACVGNASLHAPDNNR